MSKKRIGWLKGKPIIEGDKNECTNNEIHITELYNKQDSPSGGGSGGGNSEDELYLDTRALTKEETTKLIAAATTICTVSSFEDSVIVSRMPTSLLLWSNINQPDIPMSDGIIYSGAFIYKNMKVKDLVEISMDDFLNQVGKDILEKCKVITREQYYSDEYWQ